MTPWEGHSIRSDGGVLLRCVGTDALRVERWDPEARAWVDSRRAVWDFDFLPLARLNEMRDAGLYTAAEWSVLELAADEKGWAWTLTHAPRIFADASTYGEW